MSKIKNCPDCNFKMLVCEDDPYIKILFYECKTCGKKRNSWVRWVWSESTNRFYERIEKINANCPKCNSINLYCYQMVENANPTKCLDCFEEFMLLRDERHQ